MTLADAVRSAVSGENRAIARILSALENGLEWGIEAAKSMSRLRFEAGDEAAARSRVIGITGPPGSGKSSLIDRLIGLLRSRSRRVAVIAIDPSSPRTGGALLGDRIRMNSAQDDPGVFIRSMASRGEAGGLAPAACAAVRVLEAAGFEEILVETSGTGQSDVGIVGVADIVVLVYPPGLGDDIQAMKAGIVELADVIAVNKADHVAAESTVHDLRRACDMGLSNGPEVVPTVALTGAQVDRLMEAIDKRFDLLERQGVIAKRRARMKELEKKSKFLEACCDVSGRKG
jgi:LAO/AO transport system kinase